jgi:hypothetical protein
VEIAEFSTCALANPFLLYAIEAETGFAEGMANGRNVACAASLQGYIDDGFAQTDAVVGAIVNDFNNIGALAGQDLDQVEQRARPVLQETRMRSRRPSFTRPRSIILASRVTSMLPPETRTTVRRWPRLVLD